VVVLDEPTSALSVEEIDFLREFIRSLKARSALLFVSHRVSEVLDWADSVYELRDGREAGLISGDSSSRDRLYEAMGGAPARRPGTAADAESTATTPLADAHGPAKEALSVGRVQLGAHAEAFRLRGRRGRDRRAGGPRGVGQGGVAAILRGPVPGAARVSGVRRDGRQAAQRATPGPARRSCRVPVGRPPARRRLRPAVGGREHGHEPAGGGRPHDVADPRRPGGVARAEFVSSLAVRTSGIRAPMGSLSGGNQQKVLIARCLELNPRVMLLDNLTRGVDVGAKASIYELLRSLAADGVAIVMASDDLEELTTLADRILIFRDGRVAEELDTRGTKLSQADVLAVMV
jgi:ABC-type sugar transport system ATPase subunit